MSSDDSYRKSRAQPYLNRLRPSAGNKKLFHSARTTISRRFHTTTAEPVSSSSPNPTAAAPSRDQTATASTTSPLAMGSPLGVGYASAPAKTTTAARRVAEYENSRLALQHEEGTMAYDHACKTNASAAERVADVVVQCLRVIDEVIFGLQPTSHGHGTQKHPRFAGDHYLSNEPLIADTQLLKVAHRMPKGAHLHIHFNACLLPTVLLEIAEGMSHMFIKSDRPLVIEGHTDNFFLCEITFSIVSEADQPKRSVDMFSANYDSDFVPFGQFLKNFTGPKGGRGRDDAMKWLISKLVFHESETYSVQQTAAGAWERFNVRTRMMKGLFNYKTAYVKYTEMFLEDLLHDNIQYAEIRPNFMPTNQLFSDDGTQRINNEGIVNLIIEACETFKKKPHERPFDGLKIIYCTPRSFSNENVKKALDECIVFKKKFPDYIAGFDLVGEEGMGKPLKAFVPEFLQFQEDCAREGLDIPFLFHCGETLDIGRTTDQNVFDALLLNSKRIGHGFALARHPAVMQKMKQNNVCVEVCPISNEVLGLTPRVGGHTVYSLLANNVHCTVNSDNGTLFKSTLSHDFYQLMVGKSDMGLFGWRQLAEWSLQHACLTQVESEAARDNWSGSWNVFIGWLLQEYSSASSNAAAQKVADQVKQDAVLKRALDAAQTSIQQLVGRPVQGPYSLAKEDIAIHAVQAEFKDALERMARAAMSAAQESGSAPDLRKLHDDIKTVALWLVQQATCKAARGALAAKM